MTGVTLSWSMSRTTLLAMARFYYSLSVLDKKSPYWEQCSWYYLVLAEERGA